MSIFRINLRPTGTMYFWVPNDPDIIGARVVNDGYCYLVDLHDNIPYVSCWFMADEENSVTPIRSQREVSQSMPNEEHELEMEQVLCAYCGRRYNAEDKCMECRRCPRCCYGIRCDGCDEFLHETICGNCNYCENCCGCSRCYECDRTTDELCEHDNCSRCCDCNEVIKSHDTDVTRTLKFFGKEHTKRFFGVELEVEASSMAESKAKRVLDTIGRDFVVCKHDGSLNNGFEIVTAPATVEIHRERWKPFFKALGDGVVSLKSESTHSCGLHVHVSRPSALTVGKLLVFVNDPRNKQFIVSVARRESPDFAALAKKKLTDALKNPWTRYESVNIANQKTIEFRIFKGTLNEMKLYATLEFCESLCAFVEQQSCMDLFWKTYVKYVDREKKFYPNLWKYLKEMRSCATLLSDIKKTSISESLKPSNMKMTMDLESRG